jgi:uncharacterized Zn-binding protein involved in type VI secretion
MGIPFICVGDKTSGGGVVVEGSPTNLIDGRPMARVGDKATCTRKNHPHTVTIVTTSDPSIITDGKPQAFHGDKLSCGCTLIASQFMSNSDPQGGGDSAGGSAGVGNTVGAVVTKAVTQDAASNDATYDEQTQLVAPLVEGLPYFIETSDGRTFSGRAAAHGKLPRIQTDNSDEYAVHWGDEALARMGEG